MNQRASGIFRLALSGAACACLLGLTQAAFGQEELIYAGSKTGAYTTAFAPALQEVLDQEGYAYEIKVTPGSSYNLQQVAQNAKGLGFSQLDALALYGEEHPDDAAKLEVVKDGLVNECIFAVAQAGRFDDFGALQRAARKGTLTVSIGGAQSGTEATLKYLAATNSALRKATFVNKATKPSIANVAKGKLDVAFFVAFPKPSGDLFEFVKSKELAYVPVVSRRIARSEVAGIKVYSVNEVQVSSSFAGLKSQWVTTACTPLVLVANSASDDAEMADLRAALKNDVPAEDLRPAKGFAEIFAGWRKAAEDQVEELMKKADVD